MGFLLLGNMLGGNASPEDTYRHLGVFSEVLGKIKSDYVEEPDMKTVTLGAINGLLESLDPYASYLSADQYKQYQKEKDTNRPSVGLVMSKRFGYISIVTAIAGSPAAKAGLSTGDVIETIAGVSTRDMPLAFADLMLHGDAGSTVELSVLRFRKPEPQKVPLVRTVVQYPAVTSKMLPDSVGYVQVQSMEAGKMKEISNAVQALDKQGAQKLILDLRWSSTGLAADGIALANLFMEKGQIATLQGQKFAKQTFDADSSKTIFKKPLTVIANRGTASAAELAAAALLDSKRAEVVGERTYGDAALRKAVTMEDGAAVILSIAKYYAPSGKTIQDNGVTPSVPAADIETAADPDTDEPGADPQDRDAKKKSSGEDALLKKAIEVATKGVTQAAAPAAKKDESGTGLGPLNVPRK